MELELTDYLRGWFVLRVMVFGLGALGTVYSCLLKNSGHEVFGLDREPVINKIKADGVRVEGIWGDHQAFLDTLTTDIWELADEKFDLVILTVKSYETEEAVKQIKALAGPDTYLLLAQNGYGNYKTAARYMPQDRIILGRIIFGAETIDWGYSKVTVIADDVLLGSPPHAVNNSYLEDLANIFSAAGIPTRACEEVMQYVWAKIIYNSALNPLGAILEVAYGELAADESCREIMNAVVGEIFAVLAAIGQPTPWPDAEAYLKAFYGQMVPSTVLHHASMLQDIKRGRRTEIDALNGAVAVLGAANGVDTPVNKTIVNVLKAKETLSQKPLPR
jgi:2-dehydropantoate 2-reductase